MSATVSLVDQIVAHEAGELDDQGTLILFGQLIASGQAWTLQGSYGRQAAALVRQGLISPEGAVDWDQAEDVGIERPVQVDPVLHAAEVLPS